MKTWKKFLPFLIAILLITTAASPAPRRAGEDPSPPSETVKLIFIHHSTGQNWLQDGYGNLGQTLGANNYFVSDTNYGWGPNIIGDRTDIPHWTEWFASPDTPAYMSALYSESGKHSSYTRTLSDPGGGNEIVMFKSCFPNSNLAGNPDDPPSAEGWLTVGHAKYVYNQILPYFGAHPEKLFVVITAPPVQNGTYAANARAFNQWLMNNWLSENAYTLNNVFVFDFYNVLTDPDAHHRYYGGAIEHDVVSGQNTLYYDSSGDDHPSAAGSQKATDEFVPLLNIYYHRWKQNARVARPTSLSPHSGYVTNNTTPTFTWGAVPNAAQYEIEFAADSGFTQNRDPHPSLIDPAFTFSSAQGNGKYYWHVRAYNGAGQPGDWSAARYFTVDVVGPAAPTLQLPGNTAIVRTVPTFRWNAVSDAVLYQFQLDNDADCSSPFVSVVQRTLSRKPAGGLRGTYYWRVRAKDAAGTWGGWSTIFTVTVTRSR